MIIIIIIAIIAIYHYYCLEDSGKSHICIEIDVYVYVLGRGCGSGIFVCASLYFAKMLFIFSTNTLLHFY